jgi:hypothetical protein
VDGLFHGLVGTGQQDEDFCLGQLELLGGLPRQRTRRVDRVHDRPREWKEGDLVPLERQRQVTSHRAATAVRIHRADQDLRFKLDDFIAAPVHDPEHQRPAVVVRRNHCAAAEQNRRRRPRKPCKQQPGRQGLVHQAHQRLDGDHHVGREAVWTDLAVPDGGKGLNAEEERTAEAAAQHHGSRPQQRLGPAGQIGDREHEIEHDVEQAHQAQEAGPGGRQQLVVRREALENAQTGPDDIEGAVSIEQPLPALAADKRAEPQISVASLFLGRAPRREGTGLEYAIGHARIVRES